MSSQFYAINESGIKVPKDANELLGIVPIVTVTYLSFEDMSWNDISRVSHRVGRSSGCYVHRLGEKKSVELTDGTAVKVSLVGLTFDHESGFVFQITDGLHSCNFSNFMSDQLYELLPDDLKDVIRTTSRGTAWIPSKNDILGPDIDGWYDWYEYHNTRNDRRLVNNLGEYEGYWIKGSRSDGELIAINEQGNLTHCSENDKYLPSICFFID